MNENDEREQIDIPSTLYHLGFRGWRVKQTGVEFILPPICEVATGSFLMGSSVSDHLADADEEPQIRIQVGAFAIGKYPVTVEEYRLYLKANPGVKAPWPYIYPHNVTWAPKSLWGSWLTWDMQCQQRLDHPVVCMNWFNAQDYAAWLARTTRQPWRLPTEAEWEKAARWDEAKQHARIYPWGDTWDTTCTNTEESGLGHTTPVGAYPTGESPYQAQDMAGSVGEWLSSLYKPYPYDPATCETQENTTGVRVLRGGAWDHDLRFVRAACRIGSYPNVWYGVRGFRVARGSVDGAS